jgi:hypothetical protein
VTVDEEVLQILCYYSMVATEFVCAANLVESALTNALSDDRDVTRLSVDDVSLSRPILITEQSMRELWWTK